MASSNLDKNRFVVVLLKNSKIMNLLTNELRPEKGNKDTCDQGRTYGAGNNGTHGMHEQVIMWIVFLTKLLGNTGCHRHGRYS